MTFASEIEYEPSESGRTAKVDVVLINQDGSRLMTATLDVDLHPPVDAFEGRQWVKLPFGLGEPTIIEGPGRYRFDVLVDGHIVGHERLIFATLA
jgi:hypothetical protein